jgi:hypothetical protein
MLVPDYDTLPSAFKFEVVPKLFAAVVRHQEWLRATLPRNHPLLSSALLTVHDSLVRGAQPHVQEQKRHASECTGIPLSLQTHLLVREALAPQAASQQVAAPLPPPAWLCDAAAAKRNNLCMRTLYPLPRGYKLNKLSVAQCWRAWWTDTPTEPLPLRFLSGKLTVAAEKVRYTRYKKCTVDVGRALAAPTPSVQSHDAFKCCCGVVFQTKHSLKRHHNGTEGRLPRERAHACSAGCMF